MRLATSEPIFTKLEIEVRPGEEVSDFQAWAEAFVAEHGGTIEDGFVLITRGPSSPR